MTNLPEHDAIPNNNILDPDTEVSFHDEQEYAIEEFGDGYEQIIADVEESRTHPEERKPRPPRTPEP